MSQSHSKPTWPHRLFMAGPSQASWTIGRKILWPVFSFTAILMLALSTYMYLSTAGRDRAETEESLNRIQKIVDGQLNNMETLALGLARQTASSPEVQAAFAAHDRELLTELTLPTFEMLADEFAVKQFQFFLPPATSFLRLHQLDKFGDDLSSIRATFLRMDETRAPVSGPEIGRGGLGVRGVVPVYHEGQFVGGVEIGLDVGTDFLAGLKEEYGIDAQIMLEKEAATASTFEAATAETLGPTEDLLIQASTLPEPFYVESSIYPQVLAGDSVISTIKVNNRTYAAVSFPLRDYSGKVIGVLEVFQDRTDTLASDSQNLWITILVSLAMISLGAFFIARFINRTVRPIHALTETALAVAGGDLERQAVIQSSDEIGILANAFNNMTGRLRALIGDLETRVAERTQNLELAAEVGRAVSQVRALDVMLKDAAEIIRSRFDLYYTQVYLTNPAENTLILHSGTGEVGAQLVARGHRLPIDVRSINGRAAQEKRSVVISDTAASTTFRPNSLLPETRSEMAVPLMVGVKVVGVLDLQSSKAGALSEELLPAYEALAGQLAIAIQNANLLAEVEQARADVESQSRRVVKANWREYLDAVHKPEFTAFEFTANQVTRMEDVTEAAQIAEADAALSASIAVSGEPIGILAAEFEAQNQTSQNAELISIVAQQVAQHIESLRLLESAERFRAEAEAATHRATLEGWKQYMESHLNERIGYLYDTKEVRPQNEAEQLVETALSLPIKAREEIVGKLEVAGLELHDDQALELANVVAERLGAHIENLRLSYQTQTALAQSERLFDASRRLNQSAGLQELMDGTVTSLGISEVNRALLATFDYDEKGEVRQLDILANWWNHTGHEVTPLGTRYPLEVIRVMPMFISPVPVFFSDALNDPRVDATTMELVKRLNLRAVAVLPLHLGSRHIGALILEAEQPHNFTQDEIRLFSALAPQIATAVENRRQFEQAQQQAEREAMLNTIGQKIQSATTVEAVLQIAARELGRALGAPLTVAQLGIATRKNGNEN